MPNLDLLPSLLYEIKENQLALEAAIMELSNWIEQRGSAEVAENVRGALWARRIHQDDARGTHGPRMNEVCKDRRTRP